MQRHGNPSRPLQYFPDGIIKSPRGDRSLQLDVNTSFLEVKIVILCAVSLVSESEYCSFLLCTLLAFQCKEDFSVGTLGSFCTFCASHGILGSLYTSLSESGRFSMENLGRFVHFIVEVRKIFNTDLGRFVHFIVGVRKIFNTDLGRFVHFIVAVRKIFH